MLCNQGNTGNRTRSRVFLSLFEKRKPPVQRRSDWTEPQEIKETRRAKRVDVDLSYGGEGSLARRWVAGARQRKAETL